MISTDISPPWYPSLTDVEDRIWGAGPPLNRQSGAYTFLTPFTLLKIPFCSDYRQALWCQ